MKGGRITIQATPIEFLFFTSLFGICIGSFLNVCLLRWKNKENIAFPASHCPICLHSLSWYENIPVLSFICLRGRCSSCSAPISWQYPLVEAATGALFVFWVLRFPQLGYGNMISGMIFLSFLVLLTTADLKWLLLPHPVNNLFVACGLLSFWLKQDEWGGRSVRDSLFGFIVVGAIFILIESLWPARLGGGDIKMVSGLGAWLGLEGAFHALTIAFALGAALGLIGMAIGKTHRKTKIPFGPFLAIGGGVVVFCPYGWLGWNA
jgi:prepilin signal peptidase PulO-like enzyme (type II secretory pathway)